MRVLVVDHDAKRLLETSRTLQTGGYELLGASGADECLRTARAQQPDLILLEVSLPDISGIDLAKEIKRDPQLAQTYVVLMSDGATPSAIQARGLENGADGFLLRGATTREFLARVDAMLRRQQEEQALRDAVHAWEATFDAVSDPFYMVDLKGTIVNCNLALAKFLGRPPSEIIGRRCFELVHGSSSPIEGCLMERTRHSRLREILTVPMEGRWLQVMVDPLLDENGNLVGGLHILSDISERKEAEDALQKEHDFALRVLDRCSPLLTVLDREGRVVRFNQACADASGYSFEEVQGRQLWQLLAPPEELEGAQMLFESLRAEPLPRLHQGQWLAKDGSTHWIEWSSAPLVDDEGAVQYVVSTGTDVTERRQADREARQALEEAQARLVQATAESEDVNRRLWEEAAARQKAEGSLREARDELKKRAELQRETAEQAQAALLATAQLQESLRAETQMRQQAEEGLAELRAKLEQAEERLQVEIGGRQSSEEALAQAHADAARRAEELRSEAEGRRQAEAALDASREALREEVSTRQGAQEELAQAQRRFRAAAQGAADLVYEWDLDTGRMELFEDARAKLWPDASQFPTSLEEFEARLHPEDRPRLREAVERHLRTGEPLRDEYRLVHEDGRVSYLAAAGMALRDESGKPYRWLATAHDITEQKHAQEEAQRLTTQRHQAESMEAIARLSGGLAQEVNDLLTPIMGNVELALAQVDPSHPLHTELSTIQATARRAAALVRQLLAVGRRALLNRQPVDLNALVEALAEALREQLGQVELRLDLASDLKPVLADKSALQQILSSLAAGVASAMEGAGTLSVETAQVTLDEAYCRSRAEARPGQFVRLTVSNSAERAAQSVQERLFEPFYRVHEAARDPGLDLAVVHGLVKGHGGWVEAFGVGDGGTRIEVYLPVAEGSTAALASPPPGAALADLEPGAPAATLTRKVRRMLRKT